MLLAVGLGSALGAKPTHGVELKYAHCHHPKCTALILEAAFHGVRLLV